MIHLIETFIYYVNQHIITVFIAVIIFIKLDLQAWVIMPSQLSRQSVRLLTDWSQVRALSTALLGPQLSQVERPAHNRKVMGSNPIGPMLINCICICMLRWCSPANHFGLSSRRLGFESRSEHFLYLKDIWESPSLSLQRGCPSGQRRQAQDLLTQVYQGSNPCSRIIFYCFYPIIVFICRGRVGGHPTGLWIL